MKRVLSFMMAMIMAMAMCMTSFAAGWQKDEIGWWWQNVDGSYPASEWVWLDGDLDGVSESYYFNEAGYLLTDTTTPDGYTVDSNGAWVKDGVVQVKRHGDTVRADIQVTNTTGAEVMDGSSIPQIVLNPEMYNVYRVPGAIGNLPYNLGTKLPESEGALSQYPYLSTYRGYDIQTEISEKNNYVNDYICTAAQIFNNFPEQGIEVNAFYENSGFPIEAKEYGWSGILPKAFKMDPSTVRTTVMNDPQDEGHSIFILTYRGSDGKNYIYPWSKVCF